jgi:hypothetical protein
MLWNYLGAIEAVIGALEIMFWRPEFDKAQKI